MNTLSSIKATLKELENLLYGYNYECHFQFELVLESTDIQSARDAINSTYSLDWQKDQSLSAISYADFKADVIDKLSYRGDKHAGLELSQSQEARFQEKLYELWKLIDSEITTESTTIFIHPEIYTWVFWGFCFLIVSNASGKTYLFEGLSSD